MSYFLFETRKKIGFDQVLGKIVPQSPYGKERQDHASPLTAAELQVEFEQLAYIMGKLKDMNPSGITELKALLRRLPVIEESLGMLETGATLHDIALFTVRKFMVLAVAIRDFCGQRELFLAKAHTALVFSPLLLEKMRAREAAYSFSISDFAPQELRQAQEVTRALKQQLWEVQQQQSREIREQLPREERHAWYDDGISISKGNPQLLQQVGKMAELKIERESFAGVQYRRVPTLEEEGLLARSKEEEEKENWIEQQARRDLSRFLEPYAPEIRRAAEVLGWMDWTLARATYALEEGAVLPELSQGSEIIIEKGTFPPLQKELAMAGRAFSPLSIELGEGVAVITGANMGGKTVALKTVGLMMALAQHGIPVPAARLRFCPVEHIFLSGGEDLLAGLSSFGSEVEMFKELLSRRDRVGLFLLDEPARGTNPEEGAALVAALVEGFSQGPPLTVVTTHFNSVAMLAGVRRWQVRGLKDVKTLARPQDISSCFDFSIEPVSAGSEGVPQNALKVAHLLGLPPEITERAQKILAERRDQSAKIEPQ